ncbi:AtpZ/AtpI family protein [Flavobacterium kingsejongi]|uniref:F0F1-ATPase subunit n=1 Tax=Flavobacterium kingsejongi TaxID=1678728 RepID=A0A2S1LLF0_9FLAO|nr:AtpZ/AtpI family protein [Flavobacterium kingsejongi]AWG24587.1 F0F1-ATPase subunit [Flavobacterium kingsejongi]
MEENNPKKKPLNKWLGLINIPFQMGIIIYGFYYLGEWLDHKYPNENALYVKVSTLFGVCVALYNVIRQVNQLNKDKD